MPEAIVEQNKRHEQAVRDFNRRLRAGGAEFQFPEERGFPVGAPEGLMPPSPRHTVDFHKYLCVDEDLVRGGYLLIDHGALSDGETLGVHFLKLPLSEAIVDPSFAICGAMLLKDAIRKAPLIYGLGGGGVDSMVMKMLKRSGCRIHPVPFRFRVLNPARFLKNIQVPRTTAWRSSVLDALSKTPLLPRAIQLYHSAKADRGVLPRGLECRVVPAFGPWADALWEECCGLYSFIAIRDSSTLNWRLPPGDPRIERITIARDGKLIGWVAMTNTLFSGHKQFGSMRVGAIVDALSLSGSEKAITAVAVKHLREKTVDLIVSNQSAQNWLNALDRNGFAEAESNFIFAPSRRLADLIGCKDPEFRRVQMNRCDGDGPIHL